MHAIGGNEAQRKTALYRDKLEVCLSMSKNARQAYGDAFARKVSTK
jgi:hypothetical protein